MAGLTDAECAALAGLLGAQLAEARAARKEARKESLWAASVRLRVSPSAIMRVEQGLPVSADLMAVIAAGYGINPAEAGG
jgi:hypothetical protein